MCELIYTLINRTLFFLKKKKKRKKEKKTNFIWKIKKLSILFEKQINTFTVIRIRNKNKSLNEKKIKIVEK